MKWYLQSAHFGKLVPTVGKAEMAAYSGFFTEGPWSSGYSKMQEARVYLSDPLSLGYH